MSRTKIPYPKLNLNRLLLYLRKDFNFSKDRRVDPMLTYGLLWLHNVSQQEFQLLKIQAKHHLIKCYIRWFGTISIVSFFAIRAFCVMLADLFSGEITYPLLLLFFSYLYVLIYVIIETIEISKEDYYGFLDLLKNLKPKHLLTTERLVSALFALGQRRTYRQAIWLIYKLHEEVSGIDDEKDTTMAWLLIREPSLCELASLIKSEIEEEEIEEEELEYRSVYDNPVLLNAGQWHQFSRN